MNMLQMDYFLAVAKTLNFTSAAKSLYISQPALSKQIALLEEELGTKLFFRDSRKVVLTPAGEIFMDDLKKIRGLLDQAKQRAADIGKEEPRYLRVGCFDGIVIEDFLPKFYEHVRKIDPAMQIVLSIADFTENRHALENDEIDVLFTLDMDFDCSPEQQMQKITRRKSAIYFAKTLIPKATDQITADDFKNLPLLISPAQSPGLYQRIIRNMRLLGIEHPILHEVGNLATLRACLEIGQGYAILAESAAKFIPNAAAFPLPDEMDTWVVAVWKKKQQTVKMLLENI